MNTILEAKSELDMSDVVYLYFFLNFKLSRQNSSLADARLSPDRIDSTTNRVIMDMVEDGFAIYDPKTPTELNSKENFTGNSS